jgi:hypothetical protein
MAKRGRKQKHWELIQTLPDNVQEIVDVALEYRDCVTTRTGILKKEVELKAKISEMVHNAGFQPLKGGVIRFRHNGVLISVTPRDELIKVKKVEEE